MFPLINQGEGGGIFDILFPLILIFLAMSFLKNTRKYSSQNQIETDLWITSYKIKNAYEVTNKEIEVWRKDAKKRKRSIFDLRGKEEERFVIDQSITPRLIRVVDKEEELITFELTEIEGDGTSMKVTYSPKARRRIQSFKATLPIKIPEETYENLCKECGRNLQQDFIYCPYCRKELV